MNRSLMGFVLLLGGRILAGADNTNVTLHLDLVSSPLSRANFFPHCAITFSNGSRETLSVPLLVTNSQFNEAPALKILDFDNRVLNTMYYAPIKRWTLDIAPNAEKTLHLRYVLPVFPLSPAATTLKLQLEGNIYRDTNRAGITSNVVEVKIR